MKVKKGSTSHIPEKTENAIYTTEIDEIDHLSEVKELSEQLQVEGSRAHVLKLHLDPRILGLSAKV